MYRFAMSSACLLFFVTCVLSHQVEPTKDYVRTTTNLPNKPATQWISRRSSVASSVSPRKKTFSPRSKNRLPNWLLLLDTNTSRSGGTRNNGFLYIQDIIASYEDTSEKDKGCQNDEECQTVFKNSLCLKEAANRTRCFCPPGYYIDTSKEIVECAERAPVGSSCQISEQCTGPAVCREGICVCQEGYITDGFECVRDKRYDCLDNYECQQYIKRSVCDIRVSGSRCGCLPDYVLYDRECMVKASLGDRCKTSLQCPTHSFCTGYVCVCRSGYVKEKNECIKNSPYTRTPNFLLALIAGVICLIVVSCLLVTILSIRRKIRNAIRQQASSDGIPTISSQINAREPFSPDPAYERIDKPPSYEEAMSSSVSTLTLSIQDITPAPPPYSQLQEQGRNTTR